MASNASSRSASGSTCRNCRSAASMTLHALGRQQAVGGLVGAQRQQRRVGEFGHGHSLWVPSKGERCRACRLAALTRGSMRASDADREAYVAVLQQAYLDGRLSKGEYDERMGAAYQAVTYADLAPLLAGPAGRPGSGARARRCPRCRPVRRRHRYPAGRGVAAPRHRTVLRGRQGQPVDACPTGSGRGRVRVGQDRPARGLLESAVNGVPSQRGLRIGRDHQCRATSRCRSRASGRSVSTSAPTSAPWSIISPVGRSCG